MISTLPTRLTDRYGSGNYGAQRRRPDGSTYGHRGVDLACFPGTRILAPVNGIVTKLGYVYEDDAAWRYVQVTDLVGLHHRMFYVKPWVSVGDTVYQDGSVLGESQDIRKRYPNGITPHVHYEVRDDNRKYLDPHNYIKHMVSP